MFDCNKCSGVNIPAGTTPTVIINNGGTVVTIGQNERCSQKGYIENGLDPEPIEYLMGKPMGISYEENQKNNKRKEGKFTGNIIFLTSKNTASSAEDIITDAKKIFDNVFLAGTNTMGCVRNADNYIYRLKNSGIKIQAGSKQWINEFEIEEGVGFIPDYIVNGNLEETIMFLTKDKKIAKRIVLIGGLLDSNK